MKGHSPLWLKRHHGVQHARDVFFFVVGRYDDEAIRHGKCNIVQRDILSRFNSSRVSNAPISARQVFFGQRAEGCPVQPLHLITEVFEQAGQGLGAVGVDFDADFTGVFFPDQ